MNHFSYEQWKKYVKNEVDETVRKMCEDHLYNCDQCLETYLTAVADCEADLPAIENEDIFTDLIMAGIEEGAGGATEVESGLSDFKTKESSVEPAVQASQKTAAKKKKPFYQKTAFHYVLAAAMTFILMTSGVFEKLTEVAVSVSESEIKEETPSVTEDLLHKTFAWMDSINLKKEEAND